MNKKMLRKIIATDDINLLRGEENAVLYFFRKLFYRLFT